MHLQDWTFTLQCTLKVFGFVRNDQNHMAIYEILYVLDSVMVQTEVY